MKLAHQTIERTFSGAPDAFRIWPAGEVRTDMGVFLFSARSAELIMAAQAERGVKYPFDCDHLSMRADAPEHARRAVGWHSLDVRRGELWAVECEWSPEVSRALA